MPSPQSLRRLTLLLVCLFASPLFSEAAGAEAADPGPDNLGYLEYNLGVTFVPNQNLTGSAPTSVGFSGSVRTDPGFVVGGAVGFNVYRYMDAELRTEIAIDYRQAELDKMNVLAGQISDSKGDFNLLSAMANVYVDYNPRNRNLFVVPYMGFGVGYGRIEIDTDEAGAAVRINDENSVFVWQLMTGVIIPYTETIDFRFGYRYVATSDPNFDSRVSGTGPTRLDSEFDAHELTGGLRINF